MVKDYYKVLLVGSSGEGKTYSARNLNPDTTGFINIENKPLPFKNKFKYHVRPLTYKDALNSLIELAQNKEIETIFIDSFSTYTDLILSEARKTKKGFDIWSTYNEEVGAFLNMIKRIPKTIFITGHYEILGIEGNQEKRLKVRAKEWEGMVEKEFTIVLYSGSKVDSKTGRPEYHFNLYQEGTSAKCPPDIFEKDVLKIDNDVNMIVQKLSEFTNG